MRDRQPAAAGHGEHDRTTAPPRPGRRRVEDATRWLQRTAGNGAVGDAVAGRLEPDLRGQLEARLHADLGAVVVHADADAARRTQEEGAVAFTTGTDVYVTPEAFRPETEAGRKVLTHELAHVVQQTQRGGSPTPATRLEDEARLAAASGGVVRGSAPRGAVQRLDDEERRPLTARLVLEEYRGLPRFPGMVVFNRPVSLEEAKRYLWARPPEGFEPLLQDPTERLASGGRTTRFLLDAPTTRAIGEVGRSLGHGLGAEFTRLEPRLYRWTARQAEPFADLPWVPREFVQRLLAEPFGTHYWPGEWTVGGKRYRGQLVGIVRRTSQGTEITVFQERPDEQALKEIFGGREYAAHLHAHAFRRKEQRIQELVEKEGWSLDDAEGIYRREVQDEFLLTIWGAAQMMQGTASLMSHKPAWGVAPGGSKRVPGLTREVAGETGGTSTTSRGGPGGGREPAAPAPGSYRSEIDSIPVARPRGGGGEGGSVRTASRVQTGPEGQVTVVHEVEAAPAVAPARTTPGKAPASRPAGATALSKWQAPSSRPPTTDVAQGKPTWQAAPAKGTTAAPPVRTSVAPPPAAPSAHAAAARGRVPQAFPGRSEERSDAPPAQQHPRIEEQGQPEAVRDPRRHEPAVDEPPVTREPLEAAKEDQPGEPEPEPTFSTPTSARHPASSKLEIRPGTKEWDAAVKDLREADDGKGRDYRVGSLEEALQLLRAARGYIEGHGRYGEFEPPGSKRGYELHTNESYPESRSPWNDLPHVKWEDWQTGEKGAYGHIFYPDPHRLF